MNRTWLRIQSSVHRMIYQATGGRIGHQFGAPALLITTIGRKSGKSRTTPLFYLEDKGGIVVVATNAGSDHHPAWWLNLLANPAATIQVAENKYKITARLSTPVERAQLWPEMLTIFSGYEDYQQMTKRETPVVILEVIDA